MPHMWMSFSFPIGSFAYTICLTFNSAPGIQHLTVFSLPVLSNITYPFAVTSFMIDVYVMSQSALYLSRANLIVYDLI